MAGSNIKLLENLIDYCAVKNKVLGKNIANVGTVGYKREDVEFQSVLMNVNSSMKATDGKHITPQGTSETPFEITRSNDDEGISGFNNVDIDQEMSELAENTIRFKFASKKIGDYYRGIQNVIKGGGRF